MKFTCFHKLPFWLLNCRYFGVMLVGIVLMFMFMVVVLVVLGGERRAAEVGLVLVVAARLVVGQIVESTLVEQIDQSRALARREAVAVTFDGRVGFWFDVRSFDVRRFDLLVVRYFSRCFEFDLLLSVVACAPVTEFQM